MPRTLVVIPCFNEARRLPGDEIVAFAKAHPDVGFLLVNDGSTDDTLGTLRKTAALAPDHIEVIDLPRNGGKAEAVRQGMQRALATDAVYCGFFDADLATPLSEIPRFVECLDVDPTREIVFGARVALLGRRIVRRPLRHYLGRVFATVASVMLGLPVYDTQCGAKLFRAGALARELFAEPFVSNWVFDVELLARLITIHDRDGGPPPSATVYELPLRQWIDVAGSKVGPGGFLRAGAEMLRIHARYLRRRPGRKNRSHATRDGRDA
jgi:glycosyltransferase involved in cell wall biosynthesis